MDIQRRQFLCSLIYIKGKFTFLSDNNKAGKQYLPNPQFKSYLSYKSCQVSIVTGIYGGSFNHLLAYQPHVFTPAIHQEYCDNGSGSAPDIYNGLNFHPNKTYRITAMLRVEMQAIICHLNQITYFIKSDKVIIFLSKKINMLDLTIHICVHKDQIRVQSLKKKRDILLWKFSSLYQI